MLHHQTSLHVAHSVHETSGRANNREGSEPHALHLHETARLVPRWHNGEVGGGVGLVLLLSLERENGLEVVGVLLLKLSSDLFELLDTRAHSHKLSVDARLERKVDGLEHDVDSLLSIQTSHEHEHWNVLVNGKSQGLLHGRLALSLLFKARTIVHDIESQLSIAWVDDILNTIEDALDAGLGQDLLKLSALSGAGCNFLGILRGDGENSVRELDGSSQEVENIHGRVGDLDGLLEALGGLLLTPDLEGLLRYHLVDHRLRKAETIGSIGVIWEATLEDHVVKKAGALGLEPSRALVLSLLEVHRDQSGMPVVGDEDNVLSVGVTAKGELLSSSHGSSAEHGESKLIVFVVLAPLGSVKLLLRQPPHLLKEEGMVYEDTVNSLLEGVEEANSGSRVTEGNLSSKLRVPGIVVLIVAGGD
mmetsp:Transcript_32809/g.73747  ORF Transcript_32809/g.73747 Transcript_32809/m.73747 type:complete len:419 (+) Transcript_32809:363-1619(+)